MTHLVHGFGLPVGVRVVRRCAIPKDTKVLKLPLEAPKSLGDHLRLARIKRGLSQRQAAPLLSISLDTLKDWEMNRSQPLARQYPALIAFVGYDPSPMPATAGEAWKQKRFALGLSAEEMCKHLGIHRRRLREMERDGAPWASQTNGLCGCDLQPDHHFEGSS